MRDQTYWVIHLKTGTMLYSKGEISLHNLVPASICTIVGLDDQDYEFRVEEVVLIHKSTPEARRFFIELKTDLQSEAAELQHKRMQELLDAEQSQQPRDHVGAAIDAVRGSRPRSMS